MTLDITCGVLHFQGDVHPRDLPCVQEQEQEDEQNKEEEELTENTCILRRKDIKVNNALNQPSCS